MDWITDPNAWIAFGTLTFLEVVLGIDNLVFLSILSGRLPKAQQPKARRLGLLLALVMRIVLLFGLSLIAKLTRPWFHVWDHPVSGRDLILIAGGLFLLAKSTFEIHHKVSGDDLAHPSVAAKTVRFGAVLMQIAILDMVFSLDSVITAVGMADDIGVMVSAVVVSMLVMLLFVNAICAFVDRHPTVKILALSFLLLIGMALVGDGCGFHIPKGYVYFAMGFSLFVEVLNLRVAAKRKAQAQSP